MAMWQGLVAASGVGTLLNQKLSTIGWIGTTSTMTSPTYGFGQAPLVVNVFATTASQVTLAFTLQGVSATQYGYLYHGSTSTLATLYYTLLASNTHFFLKLEGPAPGESYAENATNGSSRSSVGVFNIVPYGVADTAPGNALLVSSAGPSGALSTTANSFVSKAPTLSETAQLLTVRPAGDYWMTSNSGFGYLPFNKFADGKEAYWPYVVCERYGGVRGRLDKVWYAGSTFGNNLADAGATYSVGPTTIEANPYYVLAAHSSINSGRNVSPWGAAGTTTNVPSSVSLGGPLIAVATS